MKKSFMNWMEEKLMPTLGKFAQNIYLQSIRDAFTVFALPVIVTGALFLIIANPPTAIKWAPIRAWANAIEPIKAQILIPFQLTFGLMALMVAFGTAYSLASRWDLDATITGIMSMLSFLIVSFPATDITKIEFGQVLDYLGGQGLFVAIMIGIITTKIVNFIEKRNLVVEMPAGVPPYVIRTFRSLVPFFINITLAWLVSWFVWAKFNVTLPQLVLDLFKPIVAVSDTYLAALAQIILMMLLWSLGIHGMNIVSSVAYPFWMTQLSANAKAAVAGQPMTGIVTEPFFHMFTHIGGSGITWPLVIMFLFSKSNQLKNIGKTAIIPTIFNINEPVIFGAPLVLNPMLFIPFILAPAAATTINYIAFATNFVPKTTIQPPFTVPIFLGGIIATGHWKGALLQLINVLVAAVIYYPFFKNYEKELVEQELAAQED